MKTTNENATIQASKLMENKAKAWSSSQARSKEMQNANVISDAMYHKEKVRF